MIARSDATLFEQLAPLIGVLTGLIAIVGVVVGKLWDRRSSAESWRRDRRMDTYARFLEASHLTWHSTKDMWIEVDHDRMGEVIDQWRERLTEVARLASQIELLGPNEVEEAAEAVLAAHEAFGQRITDDFDSGDAQVARRMASMNASEEGMAANAALQAFVMAARRALD